MAAPPRFAFLDGAFVPYAEARVPIDDRGLQFGESLYEVIPVTAGRACLLAEHVARMTAAAPEVGLSAGVPELSAWEALVSGLLSRDPMTEGLVYAQVTGGSTPRKHVPDMAPRPTFFAYVTAHRFPRDPEVIAGIRAVTLPDLRWARRDLKTTMLLPAVLAKREAARRGAEEALLLGQNDVVHEGASSNVFIVEGETLVTPAQSTELLPGTMRPVVVEVARGLGLAPESGELSHERLRRATEILVSSSSQLVMPVVELVGKAVADGRGGAVGRALARGLRARLGVTD